MTSPIENVTVTTVAEDANGDAAVSVQRANGERWIFDVDGTPDVRIGDEIQFESTTLVFGEANGLLVAPANTSSLYTFRRATRVL